MKKYEGQMYDVRRIFLVVTLVLTAAFTWADQTITGTVLDMSGEPLIGASVHVPSTSTGTITDIDGNFSLSVPDNVRQLEISYMGYKTMKADIRNGQIGVRMQEDITALQEVVAIGYGSVKKGDVTNAVAQIKAEDLEDRPVADIASALQGELAGVEVQSTSGQPGSAVSIKVRGATSINESMSSSPLFVVDGIPMDDDFGMQSLNPQDIQSIEVLKDASSSAIYGSRGANGVILITSKKAKNNDKLSVTFSTNLSLATPERYLNVMTPEEWIRFRSDANYQSYVNRYGQNGAQFGDSYAEQVAITGGAAASLVNDPRWAMAGYGGLNAVDWQKAIFKTAFAQNYNLSVMMGNKIGNMRASVGYTKQDGIVINTGFQRLNTRLQASAKL
ncbi:MAG: SusC/RagA family TonB-linked outer membrane protein, partial [Paludibacteraceae bacterium]|nr:SusC/RagA family TonB-linked outer membrane protein [Paludibacteraceae bacterium]